MKDKILILWSGGVDSTGAIYKCLTDSDLDVHAHHVHIINRLNRHKIEEYACNQIVQYLKDEGYTFQYTESTVDFTKVFPAKLPWDTEICWSMGAMVAQLDSSIKWAACGRKVDDSGPAETEEVRKRLDTLFHYMTASERREYKGVKNLSPVIHMTKKEIWDSMPKKLQSLCWYCSNPIPESQINFRDLKPCGACHTCEDMKPILGELKWQTKK